MSYALIPDGYSLKKVTKAQKQAVIDKRRHDNVVTLVNNPEIIKQIIITGTAILIAREGKEALADLKDLGVNISKDVEDAYTKKRTVMVREDFGFGVSIEDVVKQAFERLSL